MPSRAARAFSAPVYLFRNVSYLNHLGHALSIKMCGICPLRTTPLLAARREVSAPVQKITRIGGALNRESPFEQACDHSAWGDR